MPDIDTTFLRTQNTLTFRNVEYPDGSTKDWKVPPFSPETEASFWDWMERQDKRREQQIEAHAKRERLPIVTKGATWAELLAVAVKEPELDAEYLAANFDALFLEDLGRAVQDFFLRRRLPDGMLGAPAESPQPTT